MTIQELINRLERIRQKIGSEAEVYQMTEYKNSYDSGPFIQIEEPVRDIANTLNRVIIIGNEYDFEE